MILDLMNTQIHFEPDMNESDIWGLVKTEHQISEQLQRFIKGQIDFEYLVDFMEQLGVDPDEYLDTLTFNFESTCLIS